ncbi:MAG: hypothetical protein A2312_04390 [Candidatus Staskawiczbacteria bacterium RIFOXYB2_FULL_32_9]|uniref:Uncharacterized protein n=1 Tax=Candidatus Staskawiczbacteria bacterium RIFOXYD1_FULL_32_13 TaxID=1802234 RepID=A0A1G2JKD7_9BACT|nr:MAG: hypothetical protein UR22_C0009G0010 [Parcubacteria group bacterium GW2011_GWC2_32_10]OGZ77476.1 MAG: hypothetical protein A2256_00935 [Candidatus Staskawiczbacteria bacterium RIFOXYA2_FULL_32_7]OGZ78753.1 MAG: hypothetical protein A2360_01035 [Candidatus Staskawiczbacteria bacterium RIFOXYB1_FULL_32_11]OGZ81861.1 MAG: hypothetical protein A2312_04390 [Candidatus Staskawiczbacteria bacterium RIFOXYB2_FULL_32_9]OGZ85314.1 MAG: hypothetical protein A2463_00820 [Candidatus Staskawiczbacter
MKKNLLFSISLFTLVVLISPIIALAQPTSLTAIAVNLRMLITNIAILIIIVCWIITGLLFLIAQGDPSKLTKAKTALIWAIVGTVVAFLAETARVIIQTAITTGG